ncbi:MAG TPA: hypothetical protein VFV73_06630 [Streptosporangiaceae bacterium]|nr:hypothetical protein [Streptosporangiaceae bacterium]
MKISFESELMKNRKHAVVMAPDRAFEVLQSQDGDALFFSVGTDGAFYLTREVSQTATGWNRIDLSTPLSAAHGGAAVTAKSFAVAQNAGTRAVDMALVVTVGGQDFLHLSLGNGTTDAGWAAPVNWTAVPFDAGTAPAPLTIADVFVANIGGAETIFADVIRTPGDPLRLLDRYYITPGSGQQWNPHKLAADLAAGSIASCLGQRADDPVPGIYTFGTIGGRQELIFTPQYNFFRPAAPPSPARLTLPAGASAIASALDANGASCLFVAATGGLSVFTPGDQHDQSAPVQVIPGGAFAGAAVLAAATDGGRTAVWGLNPQGQLCYAACAAGSEGDPAAWSHPVPLVTAAEQFAFFLNLDAGTSVLFAHIDGTKLVRLTQDPVTTGWSQRNILLPPTAPDDMVEQDTFTTHIQVTDDNRVAVPGASLAVTATSPVSVYLNDVYHQLSPSVPVQVSTDPAGVLTVVQETATLAGACFRVALTDTPAVVADVNPMSKAQATLAAVKSGDDLAGIQVTGSDGTSRPLVPATVAAGDRDAAASALAQLATVSGGLPADGSRQPGTAAQAVAARAAATVDLGVAITAGDFFRWLEQAATDVEDFLIHEAEGLYHLVVTIAGEAYHALLDCYDAVVHAAEFVLGKVEVFFEDLVQWLGFVFGWSDIVRTHQVLKNYIRQFVAASAGSVADIRSGLQRSFTQAQDFISSWASLSAKMPPGLAAGTAGGSTQSAAALPGQDSPQSNWGTQLLRSNAAGSSMPPGGGDLGADVLAAIEALGAAIDRERDVLQAAGASLQADIIGKFHDLSFAQLVDGVVAIFSEALLQSLENVLLAVLDLLEALVAGVVDLLDSAIDIPVLSGLYKEISGDDLSLLDVICLVVAIPVTICGKLFSGAAPFPDDTTTAALIGAPDFATIQRIRNPPKPAAMVTEFAAVAPRSATDPGDPTDPDSTLTKNLVLSSAILALFGEYAVNIIGSIRREFPESARLLALGAVFYLPYNAPSFFGDIPNLASGDDRTWPDWMNLTMTSLMAIKAVADIGIVKSPAAETWAEAEPWADGAICLIWMAPTIASAYYAANPEPDPTEPPESDTAKAADLAVAVLNGIAGMAFCLNGTLAPAQALAKDPVTVVAVDSTAAALNHTWGLLSVAAAVTGYAKPG